MSSLAVAAVLGTQCASGAFPSFAHRHGNTYQDENAFITALVLWELASISTMEPSIPAAIERGLDYLEACRHPNGAFGFYPWHAEPAWFGVSLAADADDTALAMIALLRQGRIHTSEVARIVDQVLEPYRLMHRPESTFPWIARGAYRTWLDERAYPNPVDVCVNANMATLLRQVDNTGEAYDACWRTVYGGVRWALSSPGLLHRIAPFYPHIDELRFAVGRAVLLGVRELEPVSRALFDTALHCTAQDGESVEPPNPDAPICGSVDGSTIWTSPALKAARRIVSRKNSTSTNRVPIEHTTKEIQ